MKLFFSSILALLITAFAYAGEADLQQIDEQIKTLKEQLKELRRNAFNNELNAQPYMLDNWQQFTEQIQSNENEEKRITVIKEKIAELKKRKQELLKEQQHEPHSL